jgi:hypothetical protein
MILLSERAIKSDQELSVSELSKAFECCPARVKAALANKLEELKVRGRYLAVDEDSEKEVLEWTEAEAK